MKTNMNTNYLKTLIGLLFISTTSFGATSNMKILIDKGNVMIKVTPGLDKPIVQHTQNEQCHSDAVVATSGESIKISHEGVDCQRGNDIWITVGDQSNVEMILKAGSLALQTPSTALRAFSELNSSVIAGSIFSTIPGLVPVRSENYAGATAVYKRVEPNQAKPSMRLLVQAGTINL